MSIRSPEERRKAKQRKFMRQTGRPLTVTGADFHRAMAKIRSCNSRGMSRMQIERQTGLSHGALNAFFGDDPPKSMHRKTWLKIGALTFEPPDDAALVDSTGTVRRVKGMWYDGFSLPWLAGMIGGGTTRYHLNCMIRGAKSATLVRGKTARLVAELYSSLEGRKPDEFGISERSSRYARTFAQKKGCASRSCWDPDTIDDPEARPEWTGSCGTLFGHHIHLRDGVPMCPRCKAEGGRLKLSGGKLREVRLRRGLTQQGLEKLAEVTKGVVHHWEDGRYSPRPETLYRLLSVLDVTFEDLCEEEGGTDGRL